MALTVEDGTGLATADSLASVAEADSWHADRDTGTWFDKSLAQKEADLREASIFVSTGYEWKGRVAVTTQALAFPRVDVIDHEGRVVASDSVPDRVKHAVIYLAGAKGNSALQPVGGGSTKVRRKKVASLELEYFEGADAARRIFPEANIILRGLYKFAPGGVSGSAVRWS